MNFGGEIKVFVILSSAESSLGTLREVPLLEMCLAASDGQQGHTITCAKTGGKLRQGEKEPGPISWSSLFQCI